MDGVLYKIDQAKKRLTDNIFAEIESYYDQIWFKSSEFDKLNINKGDFVHYSDDDLEINGDYIILEIHNNMILCQKI